ncbi:MAG: hypothetical protein QOH16_1259 [Gaiellaceae bacterium]|nr:hypothetical protein [Gaiellaceae bacterium]
MKAYLLVLAAALIFVPAASTQILGPGPARIPTGGPTGLHGFVGHANEPAPDDHTYTEVPAFAWNPVKGATKYEIELATGADFSDSKLLANSTVQTPVTSLQIQLPWMTGPANSYALWARVRATVGSRDTQWSYPFGFNTASNGFHASVNGLTDNLPPTGCQLSKARWNGSPCQMRDAPTGLIRWTPIAGATAYEVWYTEIGVKFRTLTNVADEREFWTLHPGAARTIRWRVRAIRYVSNAALPNTLPVVSYGPYSPIYTTSNPVTTAANAAIKGRTVSGTSSGSTNQLMAGFSWTGNKLASDIAYPNGLWRVYIFSDKSCVNSVTVGSIVGGPAWAPRWAQPLSLPVVGTDLRTFAAGGSPFTYAVQPNAWSFDLMPIETAEAAVGTAASTQGTVPSTAATDSASTTPPTTTTAASTATPTALASVPPGTVELPDNSAYWWTAIPVEIFEDPSGGITYQDMELPQDACAQGSVFSFAMESMKATTYASGVHGDRVLSSASFSQLPVITWSPVLGAQTYEIQLSRRPEPYWKTAITQTAVVPSATLNLTKKDIGTWYYRVRGVNGNLGGTAIKLRWSTGKIQISGDLFQIVK